MSATIETVITCDGKESGCHSVYANADLRNESATEQRRGFDKNGWRYYKGKDYCPVCAQVLPCRRKEGNESRPSPLANFDSVRNPLHHE